MYKLNIFNARAKIHTIQKLNGIFFLVEAAINSHHEYQYFEIQVLQ